MAIYHMLRGFYGMVRVDFSQPFSVKVCIDRHISAAVVLKMLEVGAFLKCYCYYLRSTSANLFTVTTILLSVLVHHQ